MIISRSHQIPCLARLIRGSRGNKRLANHHRLYVLILRFQYLIFQGRQLFAHRILMQQCVHLRFPRPAGRHACKKRYRLTGIQWRKFLDIAFRRVCQDQVQRYRLQSSLRDPVSFNWPVLSWSIRFRTFREEVVLPKLHSELAILILIDKMLRIVNLITIRIASNIN